MNENFNDTKNFVHSYVMGCPKSRKQLQAEYEDPKLNAKLQDAANQLRMQAEDKRFGKNVIKLRKKNEEKGAN